LGIGGWGGLAPARSTRAGGCACVGGGVHAHPWARRARRALPPTGRFALWRVRHATRPDVPVACGNRILWHRGAFLRHSTRHRRAVCHHAAPRHARPGGRDDRACRGDACARAIVIRQSLHMCHAFVWPLFAMVCSVFGHVPVSRLARRDSIQCRHFDTTQGDSMRHNMPRHDSMAVGMWPAWSAGIAAPAPQWDGAVGSLTTENRTPARYARQFRHARHNGACQGRRVYLP